MTASSANRTGRRPGVTTSPEALRKALDDLATLPTIEVRTAAVLFGIGIQAAYAAGRAGQFGAVKFGRQFRFPSARVREALGISQPAPAVTIDAAHSIGEGGP